MDIKAPVKRAGIHPGFVEKERGLILVSPDHDMLMVHSTMALVSLGCAAGAGHLGQEARSALAVRGHASLGVEM
jgi:hypothetical protein